MTRDRLPTTRLAAPPTMSINVLGGFTARVGQATLDLSPSAQRVIALLALHRAPLQRLFVASTLWIDATEDRANASLRTALWRLRGPHGTLVRSCGRMLQLHPSISIDLWQQAQRARAVLSEAQLPTASEIDTLCDAGDVLPDWYDDWVVMSREQFRQARLHALEQLCERLAAEERFAEATHAGLAAVAAEPLRESAHRALIRAHLSQGNVNEALRQYTWFRVLLRRELDLTPTAAMEALLPRCAHRDGAVT